MENKAKRSYYKDEEALRRVGLRMREIRTSKKISQEKLALECDIDFSQLNRMELGKVNFSISNLYRVAEALHVDPKDLLD